MSTTAIHEALNELERHSSTDCNSSAHAREVVKILEAGRAGLAALEADNADLLETGDQVYSLAQHDGVCRMLVGDDLSMCDCAMGDWQEIQRRSGRGEHPGAAMLEELRALRAQVATLERDLGEIRKEREEHCDDSMSFERMYQAEKARAEAAEKEAHRLSKALALEQTTRDAAVAAREAAEAERDAYKRDLQAQMDGNGALREELGAKDSETFPDFVRRIAAEAKDAKRRAAELEALLNTPETDDFMRGVVLEAAHQQQRWGQQDASKTDADWYGLLGYLAGKVLDADAAPEKKRHRVIATAAVCLTWHRHLRAQAGGVSPAPNAIPSPAPAGLLEAVAEVLSLAFGASNVFVSKEPRAQKWIDAVNALQAAYEAAKGGATDRLQRLETFAEHFAEQAEAALRHHEWRAAGSKGMQVPAHGDFIGAPPSVRTTLRRLARDAREALKP